MRILFLSQLLPLPLDAGAKVRAFYVLRHLARVGHDITALCFVRRTDRLAEVEALSRYCRVETVVLRRSRFRDVWDAATSLVSEPPFLIRRDQQSQMTGKTADLARRRTFDAVHADQLWMAPYAAACRDIPFKVLDQHNAVFRVPQRLASGQRNPIIRTLLRREADRLHDYERHTIQQFDRVVWVSEQDRDSFRTELHDCRGTHETVIPIAVDPAWRRPVKREKPFRVTFVGGLHWPPNREGVRWFLEECWPAVARAVPRAVFTVIGRGPAGALSRTTAGDRVEHAGYVANLGSYMEQTAVFIVPLKSGAGMRVKILEAWCWGLPVVSTTMGAEGVQATDGVHLALADDPRDLADTVIRVLTDAGFAQRLSQAGRALVETHYDWRSVYRAWDLVYTS